MIETVTKNVEHIYEEEVEYIIYFALNIEGANIEKLENAIIELKNARDIYKFARVVKGANIEKLENAIIETVTKNVEHIYEKEVDYIIYFARDVKGANIEKLENAIIETKKPFYIYFFALNIEGANIEKLENAIIATKLVKFMQEFALNVKGANIEKLKNAIIETNDSSLMSLMCEVLGVNVNKEKMTDVEIHKVLMARRKYILLRLQINLYESENAVIFGIYSGYLSNPESTVEDLKKCNEAYLNYMSSHEKEQTNIRKK